MSPMTRVLAIMHDLVLTAGPQVRPCGETAEAAEKALGPFPALGLECVKDTGLLFPGAVYRIHAEVDADNGCFDHVLFVTKSLCAQAPCVLDSYIGVRGACCRLEVRPGWLARLLALAADAGAGAVVDAGAAKVETEWNWLFDAHERFQAPVRAVTLHVSMSSPFQCRARHRVMRLSAACICICICTCICMYACMYACNHLSRM
jgi:hypothetical protein